MPETIWLPHFKAFTPHRALNEPFPITSELVCNNDSWLMQLLINISTSQDPYTPPPYLAHLREWGVLTGKGINSNKLHREAEYVCSLYKQGLRFAAFTPGTRLCRCPELPSLSPLTTEQHSDESPFLKLKPSRIMKPHPQFFTQYRVVKMSFQAGIHRKQHLINSPVGGGGHLALQFFFKKHNLPLSHVKNEKKSGKHVKI